MKKAKSITAVFIAAFVFASAGVGWTAGGKTNVYVDCRCTDQVGQHFCAEFKQKVRDSIGYALADNTSSGYGIGVHYSCVDLWNGIDPKLAGNMSAVSVAFTIYAAGLPGEIYEDSSVFRLGKDAIPEMTRKILAAMDQLVAANTPFFNKMGTALTPSPSPTPHIKYGE